MLEIADPHLQRNVSGKHLKIQKYFANFLLPSPLAAILEKGFSTRTYLGKGIFDQILGQIWGGGGSVEYKDGGELQIEILFLFFLGLVVRIYFLGNCLPVPPSP